MRRNVINETALHSIPFHSQNELLPHIKNNRWIAISVREGCNKLYLEFEQSPLIIVHRTLIEA